MNKKCFRVIFSKTLQRLVVTSELAKSEGKSTESSAFGLSQIFAQIRPLTFSLYCALGFVAFSDSALANLIIQADKSAPKNQQPIVLQTANGLPQVNIQTPNDKGLSHNKYSKFDVDTKGAILNNSRTNVQTQQGGWVQGNPYLAKGEAKVILNEVNSSDPSVLKGYVEVAGKKADVIIANPSGLHCEGCGIINSDRATLTTGKPQIKNGHLDSFVVEKGKVKVSGKGLDNSRVDYTEVIARETEVNAGIWSKKEAKVVTGKNTVKRSESPENLQIIHTNQPLATESQPQFAIDVGELGGMYSGKIHLIGTEHGVGVRNAGHIGASADTLHIDSQGRIVNKGTLNAHHAVQLTGTKGIENRGKIENRQGNITLNTASDIQQDGSIVARSGHIHQTANQAIHQQGETVAKGDITYTAPSVSASTSSLIASGVEVKDSAQGEVRTLEPQSAQGKSITVTTTGKATLQGKNVASGNINVSSSEADLDHSYTFAHAVNVNASQGKIQANNATLIAHTELALTTPTSLETQHSDVKAEKITTKQRSLNTKGATWEQTGTGELKLDVADTLHNSGGTFKTQGDLTVNAQGVDNQQGRLIAKGKLKVNTERGKLDSTQGLLAAEQDVAINSGELMNDSGLIQSSQNVTINTQGQNLSNQHTFTDSQYKGIVALGTLDIQSGHLENQQGRIVSGGNQSLNSTDIYNQQGLIYTQQDLVLNAKNVTNDNGKIGATKQAALILTENLSQRHGSIQADNLILFNQNLKNVDESKIVSNRATLMSTHKLDNANSLIQTESQALTIQANRLDNTNGQIVSKNGQLAVTTTEQFHNRNGFVWANHNLELRSGELDNQHGSLYTQQNLHLAASNLGNYQGIISASRNATLAIQNHLTQEAGKILSDGHLSVTATTLQSTHQSVFSANQLDIATQSMSNNASKLLAKQALTISSHALDNTKGEISSHQNTVNINTHQQKLNNNEGKIRSKSTLTIQSGELDNTQGAMHSESDIVLNTHHQTLTNRNTISPEKGIIALGQLTLHSAVFANQQGYIASRDMLNLKSTEVNNTQGLLKSNDALHLTAQSVQNDEGIISAKTLANIAVTNHFTQQAGQLGAGQLTLNAGRLSSENGSLISADNAEIQVSALFSHQQSRLNTMGNLTVQSQGLNNLLGVINSVGGHIAINTRQQLLNNTQGQITAKGELGLNSGELHNQAGLLHSEQNITINTHGKTLNNQQTQGKHQGILALGNLTVDSGKLDNTQGVISANSAQLNSTALTNRLGRLQSNENLSLTTQHLENSNGVILGAKNVTLTVAETLQQTAGQIGASELTINTGAIQSTEKSVIATDNATLSVQRTLANTDSEISATQDLTITSQHINNQQGLLFAEKGNLTLNSQQHDVNNLHGKVVAGNNVYVESGTLENQHGLIQSTANLTLNTHNQRLHNNSGNIISQQALSITSGELNNEQGYIQSTQHADIQLRSATLSNQQGVITSRDNLHLTAGAVHNGNGVMDAKNLTATLTNLYQQNGTIQANQSLNLTASGEIISKNRSQVSGNNIAITSAGQLDNQQSEIIAKQHAVIHSGQLNNNDAALVAEQGNLEINTKQQSLSNQQGKLSAGANLTIQSGELDNQQGLIQSRQDMLINTHQGNLNNQQTKVAEQNKGIISLSKLALTTQHLSNQQGYLLSQQAQTLTSQSLQNDSGVLASLDSQTVTVNDNIRNVAGRISGLSTAISAQAIDNQSGLLQGEKQLSVQLRNDLNNEKGQVKAKEALSLKANAVNNREGQVRATEGTLSLAAVSTLDNTQGNITAKQHATIEANALNNQQGLVYNEQDLLRLNVKQTLDNSNGKVISKDALTMTSASLTNQQGTLYAENRGSLSVNGLLDNQRLGKIHGLGEMAIQANQIDNRGGEIRTKDALILNVSTDINNQKISETGSFIESGNVLNINAATLNNRDTKSATEHMAQGILATTLTLSAQVVDNRQGKIHSRQQSDLQIQNSLNNQQGEVTGNGDIAIKGNALHINNQQGRLQAVTSLTIFANEVTTNGHIEGSDIAITQQKDFVTENHINANRSLAITTAGNLTNQHHLYADERVSLTANHITNRENGRISSANTQIAAKGDLTNEGLINSVSVDDNAQTVIKVGGRLTNTGKGRIYGDDIALQADTMENSDKNYGNGEILSAVVAARGRLDIGAREIANNTGYYLSDNQVGATLFSVGNMTFGRTLNADNQAEGKADVLRNNSSVIESEGNIQLNAEQIYNNNTHFTVEHVVTGQAPTNTTKLEDRPVRETYIVPMGRNERDSLTTYFTNPLNGEKSEINLNDPHIPMSQLRWAGWSRAGQLVYKSDGAEPVVLKAGDIITEETSLAIRNEMSCDYTNGKAMCNYTPEGQYGVDSPIWAYFGATAPQEPQPKFPFDELYEQPWFVESEWFDDEGSLKVPPYPYIWERYYSDDTDSYQHRWVLKSQEAGLKWDYYVDNIQPLKNWETKYQESINKVDAGIEAHNKKRLGALADKYYRDFWRLHISNHRVDESKVLKTVPGQILAGSNLTATSQSFINDRSVVISGHTMSLENNIKNIDERGLHRITDTGDKVFTFDKWRGGFRRYFQRKWENSGSYTRIIETPFDMHIFRVEENISYAANKQTSDKLKAQTEHQLSLSKVNVNNDALSSTNELELGTLNGSDLAHFTSVSGNTLQVDTLNVWEGKGQQVKSQVLDGQLDTFRSLRDTTLNPLTSQSTVLKEQVNPSSKDTRTLERVTLSEQQEVRSIQPNLVIPQNVLYRVNANPTNSILIETDPDFTNQKRWLSSDYMFNALRYEPNQTQKRLGDGFYEQRLVREQINRLTGRNFVGNYTDFDSQYRGLMDAGVTFAQKFNLRPGIALSPSQVAQLTADMVWLESESVTLPNGKVENVLVPKVYALAKKGDITGNGALLSGNKVIHKGGEFINSGTVAGRELVQFDSESIRNSGNISGGAIVGNVRGDMENIGGTMEADRAILLNVAGNFNHTSQTHTTSVNEQGYQRTDTTIGRKGLLHVKGEDGTLQIQANNIHLAGADIINDGQGQTFLSAKNHLNLTALSVGFDEKMGGGNHYRNEAVQSVEVSRVQGKGDVVLSGQNIDSEAAQLEAKQRLALLAENDVVLGSASKSSDFTEYHKTQSKNVFSSSSKENFVGKTVTAEQSSTLLGRDIFLQAGNDVTLRGTQGAAQDNVQVIAGNEVLLDTILNTENVEAWEKRKKSGLTFEKSGGSARIGVGTSKAGMNNDTQTTDVIGTDLAALNGNLTVIAGGNLTANAVNLESGKDLHLQGKNVTLNAAVETQDSQHSSYAKSAGMGIGITYNPIATFKQAYGEQSGQGSAGSIVGKVITAGEALDKTSHKIMQPVSPYLSAKSSKSSTNQHQETAVVSQLNAGGNLSITATEGDITTQGALLSAKGDGNLWAKEEVTLGVATSRSAQDSHSSRKGIDIELSRRPTDVVGLYSGKDLGDGESETQHASVLSFGGNSSITAEEGNITLVGTQLVSEGDNRLTAGENIRITTAVDRTNQSERNTFHGWGEAVVSETERFSGYNRRLGSQSGEEATHKGATVASLGGNTTISAGKDFHQTSGQILAKNYASIDAQNVTFDTVHNNAESQSKQSDLKVGMFARVISPIIDLAQAAESTLKDQEASDRVKAAQLMGLAAQGYNVANTVNNAAALPSNGVNQDKAVLFRAEFGVGMSHSRASQMSEAQISQGNTVNAKQIEITARSGDIQATQTDFTSRDSEGKRIEGSRISLNAAQNILLQAGESHQKQQGKNQSYGTEVGTAFSVGAKTGWSFYAKEGFSKGKEESEQRSYENSHLDSEHITFSSGKDTTLKGAVAKAEKIEADVKGNLTIESLQDSQRSNSNSLGLGSKVEFGFGTAWEFSGNASATSGKANSKQVSEQSGLFAGEGGYHINANNVHLEGGAIASTNPSQSELSTNTLTFKDIQNESGYQAVSGSLSAGTQTADGKTTPNVGAGMPMYDGDKDNAITKATLTEGNITLNKDSQPTQTTAKALGINTELDKANEQVKTPKDINKVLKEQQIYSQSIGNMMGAVNTFAGQKAEEAKAEAEKAKVELEQARASGDVAKIEEKETAYTQAKAHQESWESGGSTKRKLDTAVAVLGTILAGKPIADTAVAAISPELNAQIHEQTKDNEGANLFAHAVLSAVEFYATGKDPLAGAVAGVAGEGTAILAGKVLGKSPSQLMEEERDMLKTAAQLAGAIAGGAAGDSTATTVAGLETAKRAVENNYLYRQEAEELLNLRLALQLTTNTEEKEKIQTRINELEKLDQDRQEHIKTACPDFGKSSSACSAAIADAEKAKASYNGWTDQYQLVGYNSKDNRPYSVVFTRDYSRVNEALVGKDELTRQKEALALDLAKSGKMSKEEAYRILDNSMTLSDTLMAVGGIKTVSNEKFMAFLTGKYKLPVVGKTQGYEYGEVKISSGAENVALYQKLKATLIAREISDGHAFAKHVIKQGEFKNIDVSTREQFELHIENVVNNYTSFKELSNGRSAYWHEDSGTVVIRNPKAKDGGTAFQPREGRKYFDEKLK